MPLKKSKNNLRRGSRKRPAVKAALSLAPAFAWKRVAWITLGMALVFSIGIVAGMRQGWVEGHHNMRQQGQLWQVRELADGKIVKHGLFREHFPGTRTLKEEGDYFMDQKHGEWTEYHLSGKVKSRASYVNGVLQPGSKEWDAEGREIEKKAPY